MDEDTENSDDDVNFVDDFHLDNQSPFPDNCPNEVHGIESLRTSFLHRYSACPAFFIGSLQNACQTALKPSAITEYRPVLVYIHHDRSLFSNIFCSNIFCSDIIINYLMENYIVWPWDVTYQSNRNTLTNVWNDIFPTQHPIDFSVEQCPMLIGIKERSTNENSSVYEHKLLLKDNILIRTNEKCNSPLVLNELCSFKDECDCEQVLSGDCMSEIGLSWEVILDICKYLPLNDAINAFSSKILGFLLRSQAKVHIEEPCNAFMNMIVGKITSEQIVSLRINTDEFWNNTAFTFLPILKNIISLTLVNLQVLEQISEYGIHFPNLTCLSLWYNNEIGFNVLKNIFQHLPNSIRRFEIHCPAPLCTHYDIEEFNTQPFLDFKVRYFRLDMSLLPSRSINECFKYYRSCFLMTTIDLIKNMFYIRCFRLIINKHEVENFFDINHWKDLVKHCFLLTKLILQVVGGTSENVYLQQKALEIQNELRGVRQSIRFQIVSG